jgi:hypothetical protein
MRPAQAAGLLAVLAGVLVLSTGPTAAASAKGRPSPKPTTHVPPGRATPSPTASPTPQVSATTAAPTTTPRSTSLVAAPSVSATPVATAVAVRHTVTEAALASPSVAPRATASPAALPARHQPLRDDLALAGVAHSLARVATTSPQLPLGLFGVLLLFLVVQNRIDRRDPKLVLNDASSSLELEFRPVRGTIREPVRRHVPLTIAPAPGPVAATDTGVVGGAGSLPP